MKKGPFCVQALGYRFEFTDKNEILTFKKFKDYWGNKHTIISPPFFL